MAQPTQPNKSYETGGMAFLGAGLLGAGIGQLNGYLLEGVWIGAGLGFLLMAFAVQANLNKSK